MTCYKTQFTDRCNKIKKKNLYTNYLHWEFQLSYKPCYEIILISNNIINEISKAARGKWINDLINLDITRSNKIEKTNETPVCC